MININDVIEQIRIANPRRNRSSITDYKGMHEFLKFVDLPDNFADLLRHLWPVIQCKSKEIQGRLSKPEQSIEAYHELIIGYSLFEHCRNNFLTLEYSPKIQNQTPDWVVYDGKQKLIIEVVTTNKSKSHSALESCLGLIKILVERGVKSKGIDKPVSYNASRFRIPVFSGNPSRIELDNGYNEFCKEVSYRIISKLMSGFGRDDYETDDSGIEYKIGLGIPSRITTRGYETCRVINSILDKGKKYSDLSKEIPVIVAVANSHQNRSKAYSPSEIAKLLYYPDTVYEPQFSRITDKEKHIKNIQDRIEDLNVLEGILFYDINVSSIYTTCYEYYPNPHKTTKWEIPERFKAYMDGSSNECKQ